MAVDPKKLIGAINPDVYCDNVPDEGTGKKNSDIVKDLAKKEGYLKAAKEVKLKDTEFLDVIELGFNATPFELKGLKIPIEKHTLSYEALSQGLEQVYFWILDFVNGEYDKAEKLVDNFVSSPGSGHFAEMQGRATRMQEESMKLFQTMGVIMKSLLNIIYDLKEFRIRLAKYDQLKSKDSKEKDAGLLSLKQIWLDSVDIKRGTGSINGMAQQLEFVTLRDAFYAVKDLDNVDDLDLNDRVKRVLMQRIQEFEIWAKESEQELRKRFEIERNYLRSQVNAIRMYSRWVKPYLKAASALEQNAGTDAALVNAFNTSLMELTLLAVDKPYDYKRDVDNHDLPRSFLNTKMRKYFPVAVIEFKFRTIPDKSDGRGGYSFRGLVDLTFSSFVLNDEELQAFKDAMAEDDFGDVYKYIAGATDESLGQLKDDLESLLGENLSDISKVEKKKKSNDEDTNPFSALFSGFRKEKDENEKKEKGIKKDSDYEKVLRSQALLGARLKCRKLYDDYKKSLGIPAFPPTLGPL